MNNTETQKDFTFRYAMLYALLCRTDEDNNTIVSKNPTEKGFLKFMVWFRGQTVPKQWMSKLWKEIDYSSITEENLTYFYTNDSFTWLKRMRMTNSYHSRLNSQKPRQSESFYPVEGFKTLQLLNLPGVFNMGDLVFRNRKKEQAGLDWFIKHPNKIMIDNGAFNTDYQDQDYKDIIDWYRNLFQKSKIFTTFAPQSQRDIMLSALYEKINVVAPDQPQNPKETLRLLKKFQSIIKEGTAQIDTIYCIQTADNREILVDKMFDVIKEMGPNTIIGIPCANRDLQLLAPSRIPYIVSQTENNLKSSIPKELYKESMNSILKYTKSQIQIDGIENPYRYHFLGSSFGPTYRNLLLNICLCSMLTKELGLKCLSFNNNALNLFLEKDHVTKTILIGKEYHPEVYKHIVSCDSSSWIVAGNNKHTYEPFAGTQCPIVSRSWLTDAKNVSFKRNMAVIASKIAEANYHTISIIDNREFNKNPVSEVESTYTSYKKELFILYNMNKEAQKSLRMSFARELIEIGGWSF